MNVFNFFVGASVIFLLGAYVITDIRYFIAIIRDVYEKQVYIKVVKMNFYFGTKSEKCCSVKIFSTLRSL